MQMLLLTARRKNGWLLREKRILANTETRSQTNIFVREKI